MQNGFANLIVLIILLPILVTLAWNLWLSYLQTIFLGKIKWVLLEVKPPKEVFKSPLAMELVLNSLYQTGGVGNWYQKYWQGNVRNYFSLEIVSTEGALHFYIRTSEKFKKLIESQIYAQYPQAEVMEVEDYTNRIPEFKKDGPIGVWGLNLALTKEDPYPIKTYIDFGLDRAVGSLAEEERIDPITPTLEFMGSIGAGEHIWMQIIVRGDTARFTVDGKEGKKWTDAAKDVIKKFNEGLKEKDAEGKIIGSRRATKGELAVIEAIERNANKYGFDAGIRLLYVTNPDRFDANRIPGIMGMLRQYGSADFNGFKPDGPSITGGHDFPWQDMFGKKTLERKGEILEEYKKRKYFYGDFDLSNPMTYFSHPNTSGKKPFILSTEELATLYHLPGRVAETPTFERIESKKAEAPGNLPI
ncbi:MAG TPA: hypothetical protein VGE18_01765 [Candidatus Paceibacterota bacterium]